MLTIFDEKNRNLSITKRVDIRQLNPASRSVQRKHSVVLVESILIEFHQAGSVIER